MCLKKLKIVLPYDPAIPLLGIYPEKTLTWKDTCTPMFTEALFAIAKTWKQPKCPLIDEWKQKMWYTHRHTHTHTDTHNGILLSHKKIWNNAICSNMNAPRDCHTEWSKSEKDKYHMIFVESAYTSTYMWNLKTLYKWVYLQNRKRPTDIANKFMVTKGEMGKG